MTLLRVTPLTGTDGSRITPHDMLREYSGAHIRATANQTLALGVTAVAFNSVVEDVGGWTTPAFPNVLVVPAGVSRVQAYTSTMILGAFGGSDDVAVELVLNGAVITPPFGNCSYQIKANIFNTWPMQTQTIPVVEGDIFTLQVNITVLTPATVTLQGNLETYMAIEAVTC